MIRKEMQLEGKTLILETGRLAKQANGAVLATYGETVVLATATMSKKPRLGADFFPLTVDYVEKMYATGKIPGGFFKREARPSMDATLSARMIDRPLRPLFPKNFYHDVHIVITVLAFDGQNAPDVLGNIAASAALAISDIPFNGPVAAVSVGYLNNEYVINPEQNVIPESTLALTVAGTKDAVTMVEAGALELSEEQMLTAIMKGHEAIKQLVAFQEEFAQAVGQTKMAVPAASFTAGLPEKIESLGTSQILSALNVQGKQAQSEALDQAMSKVVTQVLEEQKALITAEHHSNPALLNLILEKELPLFEKQAVSLLDSLKKKLVRLRITKDKARADNRRLDEIRNLESEVGVLPCVHGSGLFTRGETQALVVVTLGTGLDEQVVDGLYADIKKFYLHYNFPPFSVGEAGFLRGPGRRELGHGALAERALQAVIPEHEQFPYTIRLVSEILESNGSSSMASVCGGSLALMDAGIPIKAPVAGIAMGLIKEGDDFAVLTDIQGLEDHYGDMDFKVTGTEQGITALQMDIKITGISEEIMRQALAQARQARLQILQNMTQALVAPRAEISRLAPRIESIKINPDKIGALIGPGGKNVKGLQEKYSVKIEINDDGLVRISSTDVDLLDQARAEISAMMTEPEVGMIMNGTIDRVVDFGAFIDLPGGKSALVHISEIADHRIAKVEDVLKLGQKVKIRIKGIDNMGRVSASMKGVEQGS